MRSLQKEMWKGKFIKYNRKIIPIFDISPISSASETRDIPQGPSKRPSKIYETINACLAYKASVANIAALVKIKKIENSIECSVIFPSFHLIFKIKEWLNFPILIIAFFGVSFVNNNKIGEIYTNQSRKILNGWYHYQYIRIL